MFPVFNVILEYQTKFSSFISNVQFCKVITNKAILYHSNFDPAALFRASLEKIDKKEFLKSSR